MAWAQRSAGRLIAGDDELFSALALARKDLKAETPEGGKVTAKDLIAKAKTYCAAPDDYYRRFLNHASEQQRQDLDLPPKKQRTSLY